MVILAVVEAWAAQVAERIDDPKSLRHLFLQLFVYHISVYKEKSKLIAPYISSSLIFLMLI